MKTNWGTAEIVAVEPSGASEVMARVPTSIPSCFDWLPDGRLLVVSGPEARLLVQEPDGSLILYADLSPLAGGWNEIVVDGRGNAYVNGGDYNFGDGPSVPGAIAQVTPDGAVRQVADGICLDVEGAVWYADAPNRRCVRVAEGGAVLQQVALDRGGFACTLGGADGQTLFILAAEWQGPERMMELIAARTGQVLSTPAPAPAAGFR